MNLSARLIIRRGDRDVRLLVTARTTATPQTIATRLEDVRVFALPSALPFALDDLTEREKLSCEIALTDALRGALFDVTSLPDRPRRLAQALNCTAAEAVRMLPMEHLAFDAAGRMLPTSCEVPDCSACIAAVRRSPC